MNDIILKNGEHMSKDVIRALTAINAYHKTQSHYTNIS